jgi:AcrR family transcriptional regulator
MAALPDDEVGLRERKKLRTRRTIERVALDLFTNSSFQATTLAEIARAAEVAPSTLYTYFPTKEDILFAFYDRFIQTARQRVVDREPSESLIDAIQAWVSEDVPAFADDEATIRKRRTVIDGDDTLLAQERLRLALLEDVFAEAFARDLGEDADDLRSQLMASVTVNGLRAIWFWWYRHQTNQKMDPREPYALDATYLTSVIKAAETALEAIPKPAEYLRTTKSKARRSRRATETRTRAGR